MEVHLTSNEGVSLNKPQAGCLPSGGSVHLDFYMLVLLLQGGDEGEAGGLTGAEEHLGLEPGIRRIIMI